MKNKEEIRRQAWQNTEKSSNSSSGSREDSTEKPKSKEEIRRQARAAVMTQGESPVSSVNGEYIDRFVRDANQFLNWNERNAYDMTWASSRSRFDQAQMERRWKDLQEQALNVGSYLREMQGGADWDNSLQAILDYADSFNRKAQEIYDAYDTNYRYYDQFESENDYNWHQKYDGKDSAALQEALNGLEEGEEKEWVRNRGAAVYNREMMDVDVEASRRRAESLRSILDNYKKTKAARYVNTDPRAAEWLQEMDEKFGGEEGLEKAILQEEQKAALAERVQTLEMGRQKFDQVVTNADFVTKSAYDPTNTEIGYRYINGDDWERYLLEREYGQYVEEFGYHAFDSLTDAEKDIYNYYMNTGDRESAAEYLDYLRETLAQRKGAATAEAYKGHTAGELVYGIEAGLDQYRSSIQGLGNMIRGESGYVAPSATQYASGLIREDLANTGPKSEALGGVSLGQAAYDAVTTSANMAPSILASTVVGLVNPVAGAVIGSGMMGAGAAGSAYQEMVNAGYSTDQARLYGGLVGTAEVVMESLLGGISKVGGGAIKNITKWASNLDSAIANAAIRLAGAAGSEGFEEGLQEIFSGWLKSQITKENFYAQPADVIYSSLLGALTGGLFEGPGIATDTAAQSRQGREVLKADGVEKLKALGMDSEDADVREQAGKITDKTKAFGVGGLVRQVEGDVRSRNAADIAKSMTEKGMDAKTAEQYGETLSYMLENGSATELQRAVMESDPVVGQTLREIQMPGSSVQQRAQNLRTATGKARSIEQVAALYGKQAEAVKKTYALAENQDVDKFYFGFQRGFTLGREGGNMNALEQVAPDLTASQRELAYKIGRDAVAAEKAAASKRMTGADSAVQILNEDGSVGENVRITGIDSKDGNSVTYRLEDGRTVSEDQLSFSGDNAVLDTVKELGLDLDTANIVIHGNNAIGRADTQIAHGIEDAFRYGSYGYSLERLAKDSPYAAMLTEEMRTAVYNAGKNSPAKAQKKPPAVKVKTRGKNPGIYYDNGGGDVRAYKPKEFRDLEGKRKAGVQAALVFSKLGIGGDFYFFESYKNAKGERVYRDENGVERKAPNGWYDPSDGSIHIDLNAGNDGQGTTLFTMAHELTHYIEQWSPEKYKVLADFLIQNYEKGRSMDELVRIKQMALSEGRAKAVSYEEAYSEVIADSMEAMLADGNVMDKLLELKAKDRSLFRKMKEFFDRMLKKITGYYEDLVPESEEGKLVLEMKDQISQIQQLFAEALADAGENFRSATEIGMEFDADTESVAPMVQNSERTWRESDYVQAREKAVDEIHKATGVSLKKAEQYIDSVNSIAKMIAEDRTRLDYFSSPGRSSFVSNVEYGGSFDFSTLCKKRRLLTGTFTAIQKALPNTALTANEILNIRNRMKKAGLEVSCGLCYVEGSRANMGQFAKEFLRLYKQYYPDAWQPNMADVNTPDGIEWVRINHPECYEQYEYFWNHYGTLKPGDKNLFASQQKPKLYQLHTEYNGEILQKFKNDDNVEEKNLNGGIRLQSFSDFEIVHLIDTMQIIMDMSRVGLAGQAYTKVPDFAWALGDTGLKINLSLIAKGVDENGKLIFDDVEGMPIADAMKIRERYSKNVGTILVAFNDAQLTAAMADDRVDFIIPFHRSQWKKSQYEAMGLPARTKDYTYMQNEKFIKPQYHEYRGRMVKDKATNYMPNEYWDFSKSGKENAIAYLEMCARNNKRPKFYKLLQNNGDGSFSLKADGSTDGYWKLLIDFKMYDNDGVGSPQTPVRPEFNMDEATRMLDDYKGGHSNFPVAQGIVDEFVKEYKQEHQGRQFSERYWYPNMLKGEIAEVKSLAEQEATTTDNYLGIGVKWLYNNQKGHRYFALYSTEDEKGSTVLYACKDERAEFEYKWLMIEVEQGGNLDGHTNTGAGPTVGILKRIRDAAHQQALHYGRPAGTGSNSGNAAVHSRNRRKRLSTAFLNCLKNIAEVQSRYGVDDHYLFAVERGNIEAAQRMVNEAAKMSGYTVKAYHGTPIKGITVFDTAKIGSTTDDGIFGHGFYFSTNKLTADGYSTVNGETMPVFLRIKNPWWGLGHKIDDVAKELGLSKEILTTRRVSDRASVVAPLSKYSRIFTSHLMDNGYDSVIVQHGKHNYELVVFDNTRIKSADPVTYDDNGNVIPLSERFNSGKKDIRYQDRSSAPVTNRTLLANALESTAQHELEVERIREYKAQIGYLEEQEAKLAQLRSQIRELSFAKGKRDMTKLKELKEDAAKTANRIGIFENELKRLEVTPALQKVLKREMARVRKETRQKNQETLARYQKEVQAAYEGKKSDVEIMEQEFLRLMKSYEKHITSASVKADKQQSAIDSYKADMKIMEQEFLRVMSGYETQQKKSDAAWEKEFNRLLREYEAVGRNVQRLEEKVKHQREAAKAGVDSRRRTVLRNKIRKDIRELDKILNRGNKKRNVKQGMQDMVSRAISTGEVLFADLDSDTDLIVSGIQTDMTVEERKLLTEAERYVRQIAELEGNENMSDVLKARKNGYAKVLKQLHPVLERERIRINSAQASTAFGALVDAYRSLKTSEDEYIAKAFSEEVLEYLEGLKYQFSGTLVKDMSQEQLQALHKGYKMVMTTIRNANKAFVDGRSIQAEAEQMVREFQSRKIPQKTMGVILKNLSDSVGWSYEKLFYALDRINSPTLTRLFGALADSENITMRDVQEAKAFQKEMVETYHYNDWKIDQKIDHNFLDNTGKPFRLTLGELLALYAYSRREGADTHIEVGGFKLGKTALTNPEPAATYKLTADQVATITGMLTPEQKAFARAMQKYLSETMGAKGNEVSMKLYGIEMFGEENYFPLHIAGEYKARAQESQAKAEAGFQTMSNAGFTKARNKNSTAPIVLEDFMTVWADHVNEMSRYHGAVPALEDIRRVMNYSVYSEADSNSVSVKAAMTNAYGEKAVEYFDELYREANSGAITDKMEAVPKKLLSLFRKNAVAYSLSVVIQQPASIYRARALVDRKYFGKHGFFSLTGGVLRILNRKKWNAAYEEMMKYAPGVTMAKEIGGFDTSTGGSIRSYLLDTEKSFRQSLNTGTGMQKAGAVLGVVDDNVIANLPNVADKIAWIEMWEACKRETVARNPGLSTGSEAFLEKVGQRFTEVIRATQVYDSMFSKSPMLKSKNLFVQSMVSFMNEPNTVANMAEGAVRDATRGDFKQAGKAVAALVTSIAVTNILKSLVYAMRDDDEDETFQEKYVSTIVGNLISDVNPLNYIPFARDAWSVWQGYDVERSDMAIVADALNVIRQLVKVSKEDLTDMTAEELEEWDKRVTEASWAVAENLSALFGIPLKNIRRDIMAVVNTATGSREAKTKQGLWNAIEEGLTGSKKNNRQQLYEAIVSGDTEHASRVEARYTDEKKLKSDVRKALRENDPRIRLAAQAKLDGDISEYSRIAEEIVGEGNWGKDDVVSAINTQINAMEDTGKEPAKKKSKSYYSSSDFAEAVRQGDVDMAEKISQDLVQTAIANGKNEREAHSSFVSGAKSELKELYMDEVIDSNTAVRAMETWMGISSEDASDTVFSWDFERRHDGQSYDEFVRAYKDEEIGESDMRAILKEAGYDADESDDKIAGWNIYRDYGVEYSEAGAAYLSGELDRGKYRSILIDYGYFPAKADQTIATYDWMRRNPDSGLLFVDASKYAHPIENYGKSLADVNLAYSNYLEYKKRKRNCTGVDGNNDGKADSGTVQESVFDMINSLPITEEQKDALASIDYGMKSIRRKAPWHR